MLLISWVRMSLTLTSHWRCLAISTMLFPSLHKSRSLHVNPNISLVVSLTHSRHCERHNNSISVDPHLNAIKDIIIGKLHLVAMAFRLDSWQGQPYKHVLQNPWHKLRQLNKNHWPRVHALQLIFFPNLYQKPLVTDIQLVEVRGQNYSTSHKSNVSSSMFKLGEKANVLVSQNLIHKVPIFIFRRALVLQSRSKVSLFFILPCLEIDFQASRQQPALCHDIDEISW